MIIEKLLLSMITVVLFFSLRIVYYLITDFDLYFVSLFYYSLVSFACLKSVDVTIGPLELVFRDHCQNKEFVFIITYVSICGILRTSTDNL